MFGVGRLESYQEIQVGINCKLCVELLPEYNDGELPDELNKSIKNHLNTCKSCRDLSEDDQILNKSITSLLSHLSSSLRLRSDVEASIFSALGSMDPFVCEHSLMELFEELTFREKWKKVFEGLKQPKESGDYKWAHLQVLRLLAPVAAIVIPALLIFLLVAASQIKLPLESEVKVEIVEPIELESLDEIEEIIEAPHDLPEIEIAEISPEVVTEFNTPPPRTPDTAFSPQPASFDSVAMVRSPVIMRGILGGRSPGARGSALGQYGGGGPTEEAVLRALRWLKKYQEPDGSWLGNSGGGEAKTHNESKAAFTGLALLTYLAHGETTTSEEFGETVEKALRFLVGDQDESGIFKSRDENNYTQPIATYALCEASVLCSIPMVKDAARKGVDVIIKGQQPVGGWTYNFDTSVDNRETITKAKWEGGETVKTITTRRRNKYSDEIKEVTGRRRVGGAKISLDVPNPKFGKSRNDLSFSGWCAQALKAARIAKFENEGLEDTLQKALLGLKANETGGAFSYVRWAGVDGRASSGDKADRIAGGRLTGVGILCLQLLGDGSSAQVKQGLNRLANIDFNWETPYGTSPVYYWYYITQAKFHAGGKIWNEWNKKFSSTLVYNQVVEKGAGIDGKDIGYWDSPSEQEVSGGRVQDTCLCTLQLEVYYRYLPTFHKLEDVDSADIEPGIKEAKDIEVEIRNRL